MSALAGRLHATPCQSRPTQRIARQKAESQEAIKKLSNPRNPALIHSRRRRQVGQRRPVLLQTTDRPTLAPTAAFPRPASAANLSSGYLHGIGRPAFRTSRLGRSALSRRHGHPRRPPAAGCGLGPAGPLQLRLAPVVSATEWPPRRHPDPLRPLAPIRSAVAHTREPRAATLRQGMGLVGYAVGVGARASATCRRFSDMVGPPRHWSAIIRRDQGQVRVRSALTRKQAAALLASRAPGQEVAEESRPDHAVPMKARRRIQ